MPQFLIERGPNTKATIPLCCVPFFEELSQEAMNSVGCSKLFFDPVFTSDLILDRSAKFAEPDLDTLSLIDRKHLKQDLVLGANLGN